MDCSAKRRRSGCCNMEVAEEPEKKSSCCNLQIVEEPEEKEGRCAMRRSKGGNGHMSNKSLCVPVREAVSTSASPSAW